MLVLDCGIIVEITNSWRATFEDALGVDVYKPIFLRGCFI